MRFLTLIFVIFVPLFSSLANDQSRTETLKVKSLEYKSDKKLYRLHIAKRAGAYYAKEESIDCIKHSIDRNVSVEISFNVKTLIISACQVKL